MTRLKVSKQNSFSSGEKHYVVFVARSVGPEYSLSKVAIRPSNYQTETAIVSSTRGPNPLRKYLEFKWVLCNGATS